MLKLLAFDYGASSGRAVLGSFNGSRVELGEMHRFSNDPVFLGDTLHWDFPRQFHEMKQGIIKSIKAGHKDIAGIGIDTWGVDFGLLGPSGELLGNPVHYRDSRTDGILEEAFKIMPRRDIYEITGTAFQKFNTLYQLLAMKHKNSVLLEKASSMLFMPDLFSYFLTGEKLTEFTIASTSQMLDAETHKWAEGLLDKMGIPKSILTDVCSAGTVAGSLTKAIQSELGAGEIPVIAVAGHDTGSAVISVPVTEGKYAYLSSGTWSLLGVESDVPVINDTTYELNYTNEGGYNYTTRLLKNIMGLWIYQECKRYWDKQDNPMSFDELEAAAAQAKAFKCFIDPDDDVFYAPGKMPQKIADYCSRTGQQVPEGKGEIVRCIMESLALKYRVALEGLEKIVGYYLPVLHIVGGGSRNTMLCQFTANALCRPVVTGPVEATAAGNIACQLLALGEVANLTQAREVILRSFPTAEYLPENKAVWDDAYGRFLGICNKRRL